MSDDELAPSPAAPDPAAPLRACAVEYIWTLVGGIGRPARAIETSVGMSNAQLFLLEQIGSERAPTIAQLGRRLQVGTNAISMTVSKLVDRGLVTRRTSRDDRRRVTITITAAGRRLLKRAPQPPRARLVAAVERMPRRELDRLVGGLHALMRAMRLDDEGAALVLEQDPRLLARLASRAQSAGLVVGLLGASIAPLVA